MARIVRRSKKGEPGFRQFIRAFPGREANKIPTDKKLGVRTLIKKDESKGVRSPEFGAITDKKGVDTGKGFATKGVTVLRSSKRDPQPTGRGRSRVRKAGLGPLKRRKNGV